MILVPVWVFLALGWTVVAAVMFRSAWCELRDRSGENGMLLIQRRSNVILFGLALAGLVAASLSGGIALAGLLWPAVLPYVANSSVRVVSVTLILVMLNALGAISLHLWLTRRRLDAYWDAAQREGRRRVSDSPLTGEHAP